MEPLPDGNGMVDGTMNADIERLRSQPCRIVSFPTGPVSLEATLTVPAGAIGLVLFATDDELNGTSMVSDMVAQQLHRGGLGILQFKLLTSAETAKHPAQSPLRFNMGLLTQRLVCAAHWIADEDEARYLPLAFFGSGTAAGAALVAAADLGRQISSVVSYSGRPDLAGNALRRVRSATLLIAGQKDLTTANCNREAYDMLACEKQICVIPQGTPELEEAGVIEETARVAADWYRQHFKPVSRSRFSR
jgi:hypothetical protein